MQGGYCTVSAHRVQLPGSCLQTAEGTHSSSAGIKSSEQVFTSASPGWLPLFWMNSNFWKGFDIFRPSHRKIDPPRKSLEWINLHKASLHGSAALLVQPSPTNPTTQRQQTFALRDSVVPAQHRTVLAESTRGNAQFPRISLPAHRSMRTHTSQICHEAASLQIGEVMLVPV